VVVLQPKGNLRLEPTQIVASAHGLTEMRLKVHVVNLWTLDAQELLAAGDVGLIPWIPLTHFDDSPEAMLAECRERIEDLADPDEQGNLLAMTHVMAEARYNDAKLLSLLGGSIMSLEKALWELPAGKRYLAKKERAAERRSIRKCIISLLETRFEDVPKELASRLRSVENVRKLDELLRLAATCGGLSDFRAALENE